MKIIEQRILEISKYFTVEEGPQVKSENGVKAENMKIKQENFCSSAKGGYGDIALSLLNNYA